MKKTMKKLIAVILAATILTMTALPTFAAGDQIETYQSPYGMTYSVNYTQGSMDCDGVHIYFGFTPNSTYVRIGGWRWACAVKADEIAAVAALDPAWWAMIKSQCETTEHYNARRAANG